MKDNMLIVHGGAPTAVMNASLYGAVAAAMESGAVDTVYGAIGGSGAILEGRYADLSGLDSGTLEELPFTPGSFIGTSRRPIEEAEYDAIADRLAEQDIRYLLFTGGNGSMDTCGRIAEAVARRAPGKGIMVAGIPKTIDNDLAVTDHAPGFGSAARYLAASVAELAQDVASLPIHVCVIESMGRNSGWLTAAAALAGSGNGATMPGASVPGASVPGPHLILVPEVEFDEDRFLDETKALYERFGGVVVVASEGLKGRDGAPIVPPVFRTGRSVYYGDVSAHLCGLVIRRLGIKARSEKPGILGRCSVAHQSDVDRGEAVIAGAAAARAALGGKTGVMSGFRRISSDPYLCETVLIPIGEVMLHERKLPAEYLASGGNGIGAEYVRWCRPLIGGPLRRFADRTERK